jgi:hypothetical protein
MASMVKEMSDWKASRAMKVHLLLLALCLSNLSTAVCARQNNHPEQPNINCPNILIEGPPGTAKLKEPLRFTATVKGAPTGRQLTYSWAAARGTILSGQGTPEISLGGVVNEYGGAEIYLTLNVGGLDPRCGGDTSWGAIWDPVYARRYGAHGPMPSRDEKRLLDGFAAELRRTPGASGTLLAYGGERGRAQRARKYLIETHGLEAGRIFVISRQPGAKPRVEMYVVPYGAGQP